MCRPKKPPPPVTFTGSGVPEDDYWNGIVFASLGHGSYKASPELTMRLRRARSLFQTKTLPIKKEGKVKPTSE